MNVGLKTSLEEKSIFTLPNYLKFIFFSLFGILLFFTPITINGTNSIPLDHLISFIHKIAPWFGPIVTTLIVIVGGIVPWVTGTYKRDTISLVVSIFRTLGIPVTVYGYLVFTGVYTTGPEWLVKPDMLPFLFEKVVMAVSLIVPIGSIFLAFIICYGLLEFIGILVRPIMRPVYRVPGKAAIDAVASFVGSFSVAIFLTNRLYNEGKYNNREAVIIMSGFSTVSATFMIIVAKTAGLMEMWNFYFWSALIITFLVTALTVRLWPITKIDDSYVAEPKPEVDIPGNIFVNAVKEGVKTSAAANPLLPNLWENLKGGMKMIFVLAPCGASIGLIAFILVKMTSVFDIVGLIFAPFTFLLALFGLPEPMMVAKACAVVLGEMFVPNLLVASLPMASKYIVAVTSVAAILFFAGSIPCILASDAKFKPWQMLVIWFERTVLSIIFAGIVALLVF